MAIPNIKQGNKDLIVANETFISINGQTINIDDPIKEHIFNDGVYNFRQLPKNKAERVLDRKELSYLYDLFNAKLAENYKGIAPEDGLVYDDKKEEWVEPKRDENYEEYARRFIFVTDMVEERLNREIKAYNMKNGTAFRSAHNCKSYIEEKNYPHRELCKSHRKWSVKRRTTGREWQNTLEKMPTELEVTKVLNSVKLILKTKSEG